MNSKCYVLETVSFRDNIRTRFARNLIYRVSYGNHIERRKSAFVCGTINSWSRHVYINK